jgi:hypothetical protein
MKAVVEVDEKKRKKMVHGSASSGSSSGAPPKYRIVYTPPGVSYIENNISKIGAIAHYTNRSNFNSNSSSSSNSSTMLLPHRHSRLPLGCHSNFLPATFHASTVGRWATLLDNAASQSKATHRELRHPSSTSKWAMRRVMDHGLATPTAPLWRRSPRGRSASGYVLPQQTSYYYSI